MYVYLQDAPSEALNPFSRNSPKQRSLDGVMVHKTIKKQETTQTKSYFDIQHWVRDSVMSS